MEKGGVKNPTIPFTRLPSLCEVVFHSAPTTDLHPLKTSRSISSAPPFPPRLGPEFFATPPHAGHLTLQWSEQFLGKGLNLRTGILRAGEASNKVPRAGGFLSSTPGPPGKGREWEYCW